MIIESKGAGKLLKQGENQVKNLKVNLHLPEKL
jgi:hypothetical protein